MNTIDFSPLLRTVIGFDRTARLLEAARNAPDTQTYPPYNIERTGEDTYVLTMAIAGFGPDDIEITARDNTLTLTGRAPQADAGRAFLYRGIAGRAFERRFVLADHMVVDGANLENGLLLVSLKRVVPEALKPRRIPVQAGVPVRQQVLEAEQAQAA
jgi:molecular chaperone IbpA